MDTLYLTLKKEWYEMIEHGEKTEEYREITDYWVRRLLFVGRHFDDDYQSWEDCIAMLRSVRDRHHALKSMRAMAKRFDAVCFSYGYTKRRMTFECKGITIGRGRPEWGAPDHDCFIIKLGHRQ